MSDVASNPMFMERQIENLHRVTNNIYLYLNHHFNLDTNDLKISMNGLFLEKKNIPIFKYSNIYLSSNDLNISIKNKMRVSAHRLRTLIFSPDPKLFLHLKSILHKLIGHNLH